MSKNRMPKVLVGCPTYEGKAYCFDEYARSVQNLDYGNYDILLADNSKTEEYFNKTREKLPAIRVQNYENPRKTLAEARNALRKKALEGNYDFFLSLEQDVIPPENAIKKLISHNKDIVTGNYLVPKRINNKVFPVSPVLIKRNGKFITADRGVLDSENLAEIEACGLGCVLISRKVLEKIKFRHEENSRTWDDMFFSKDARQAGFQIFLDPTIKCRHLIKRG